MGLKAGCGPWSDPDDVRQPPSWYVEATKQRHADGYRFMAAGPFGREQDARIAIRVLIEKTDIDWDAEGKDFERQWTDFGGAKTIDKLIAEHLQW